MKNQEKKKKVKIIQIQDTFTDYKYEYPYFQCINSKVRFVLRSKLTYDHEPVILIQNDKAFESLLPLKSEIQLSSPSIKENFRELKGIFTQDGAWITDLDCTHPGLVNFQVVFEPKKGNKTIKAGTCDTIVVMQDKVDVRFLRKMSVFPRCIGHHTKWVQFFKKQYELGYNSFHLAPIQETGMSKSYYSISDQLDLSSDVFQGTPEQKMNQLGAILKQMNKLGVTFFIDIVLNHTSFDSDWIKEKPASVYTTQNTPHLTSAFQVDKVIYEWGNEIKKAMAGTQTKMTQLQFNTHKQRLWQLITELKVEQYFQLPEGIVREFESIVPPSKPSENLFAKDPIEAIQDFINENASGIGSSRAGIKVQNLNTKWKQLKLAYQKDDLLKGIESFNKKWRRKIQNEWVPQIINNVMGEVRHNYLQNQHRFYRDQYPFATKYFTQIVSPKGKNFYAINNGWVSGADTSEANFIYSKEFYYLRRRVHVWGDLVRIRYGSKPEDAPYSWSLMQKYVCSMAKVFDGFRMDNLHGTQLHVAKYMIKKARQANPNLIVFAELFTDTEQEKAMFVRSIGINSTLKEAQHMLNGGNFIRNFHNIMGEQGPYIGSITPYFETQTEKVKYCRRKKPLILVYDLTHDNQTFYKKNILRKQLPISMLITLMGTFIGSTKGYDQFYWKHISVIEQAPLYSQDKYQNPVVDRSQVINKRIISNEKDIKIFGSWNDWKEAVDLKHDIASGRSWTDIELPPGKYQYKFKSGEQWITQKNRYVNQRQNHQFIIPSASIKTVYSNLQGFRKNASKYASDFSSFRRYYAYNDEDIVVLFRETQSHQNSVCIIANLGDNATSLKQPIILPGRYESCQIWYQTDYAAVKGISTEVEIVHHNNLFEFFELNSEGQFGKDNLVATQLPPGFACIIRSKKQKQIIQVIRQADKILTQPLKLPPLGSLDLNLILFGINREEEVRFGQSNYALPNSKQLVYAGFAGVYKMICDAKRYNRLSSPLFDNLRQGHWLLHYYVERIKRYKYLTEVADIVQRYFKVLQKLPSQLIPGYFTDFIYKFWQTITSQVSKSSNQFENSLLLACNQFISNFPNEKPNFQTTLAAGLPHFTTGWSRSWGRDTFISNELLLTQPSIYREIILQFASVLRHGTIPNLLDSGNNPRYNCRDACWWFIRGVKQYAVSTGDYAIFKTKVDMVFLSNDLLDHNRRKAKGESKLMIVEDIIQEIFQSHANGISYREWHAGYEIDSNMASEGFTINLNVDENTGFIVGGNSYNCLTWMDKMGSSHKAGTKGIPSTPRSGAPVQLVGLLKHCLSAYSKLNKQGKYTYDSVSFKNKKVTFDEWAELILSTFEQKFYIPQQTGHSSTQSQFSIPKIRGIYKDVVNSDIYQQEHRLRSNALVALALAPELFDEQHALNYLSNVEKYLIHQKSIGIATLAEVHQSIYAPFYDNDDDSDIIRLSHGYSYHNGPQWVWQYGFYILAVLHFKRDQITKTKAFSLLQNHVKFISNDQWCSLPELTDKDGVYNRFSCNAQAWSISTILMAFEAIKKLPK